MQIVVPMSGFGERFRRAGYRVPKPLIEVDGKPVIAHVVDMFPGERDFTFVCNQEHLDKPVYRMESILRSICPTGRIVGIPPHRLGPVHTVREAEHLLDPVRPVVVNYCDFTCCWDWPHFKRFVRETSCAGAIPAYRGFHPHSLGSTRYAYLREFGGWAEDIREKQPFTDDRMQEFASSGTYYFASARLMREAFRAAVEQDLRLGGEYYVSLAYKPLFAEGKPVAVYPLQHFMQWGTPEDVAEYRSWSGAFRTFAERGLAAAPGAGVSAGTGTGTSGNANTGAATPRGSVILPMAGLGRRFVDAGYATPKPMIPVSGRPMVVQAIETLPPAVHYAFVLRADMPGAAATASELERLYPGAVVETIPRITEGQACTALFGLDALERALDGSGGGDTGAPGPVTFGACDHGALYDGAAWRRLAEDPEVDVIVWCARGHANALRRPEMFGWIQADDEGGIERVSVKRPLGSPASDPIVSGTFTFRHASDFRRCVERLLEHGDRVGGEFYLDSCVNHALALGLRCRLFEPDSYLSWGTPDDLGTFEYWQSCFHKWPSHPYRLEDDPGIPAHALPELKRAYRAVAPDVLAFAVPDALPATPAASAAPEPAEPT